MSGKVIGKKVDCLKRRVCIISYPIENRRLCGPGLDQRGSGQSGLSPDVI